jgi:hypothetical protein
MQASLVHHPHAADRHRSAQPDVKCADSRCILKHRSNRMPGSLAESLQRAASRSESEHEVIETGTV